MELIILAVVELISVFATLAIPLAIDLVVAALEILAALCELVVYLIKRHKRPHHASKKENAIMEPASTTRPTRRWRTWQVRILLATAAVFLILLAGIWVANRFYFEPLMRWGAGRLEKTANIKADFDNVSGSIWSGEVRFENLTLKRQKHPGSTFDIAIDSLAMELSLYPLLWQHIKLYSLAMDGVEGRWDKLASADKPKLRRSFRVENFRLADLTVRFVNHTVNDGTTPWTLRIDSMRSTLLKDRWLFVDLLFRSNIRGHIEETPFEVQTRGDAENAFESLWKCDNLPLTVFAALAGKPFHIFETGFVDVSVENRFVFKPDPDVAMDWSVTLRDFRARLPKDTSIKEKALWAPAILFLNSRKERYHLAFTIDSATESASASDDLEASLDLASKLGKVLLKAATIKGGKE